MIRRLEDAFRLRTTAILDQVTPAGSCDFVTSVAAELPLMAIAEIIGVPVEDRDKLFDWSNRTIGGADEEYSQGTGGQTEGEDFDDSTSAMIEMAMYAHDLTDRKRENPADDLWTRLTEAVVTDGRREPRGTHRDRTRSLLHPPGRGRQRDDPQWNLERDDGVLRSP